MGWSRRDTDTFDELVELETGGTFEGKYLGNKEVTTSMGDNIIHRFLDASGVSKSMWGASRLNHGLDGCEGLLVKITYAGKEPIGNGRKVKKYGVFVDDSGAAPTPKPLAAKPKAERVEPTATGGDANSDEEPF